MIRAELKKVFCHLYVLPLIAVLVTAIWAEKRNEVYLSYFDYEQMVINELQEHGYTKLDDAALQYIQEDTRKTIDPVYAEILESIPYFKENGICTKEQYVEWTNTHVIPSEEELEKYIAIDDQFQQKFSSRPEYNYIQWKHQIYMRWTDVVHSYENGDVNIIEKMIFAGDTGKSFLTQAERQLIQKRMDEQAWQKLTVSSRADHICNYWKTVTLLLIVSLFVVLGPYLAGDRFQNMTGMLYTTKHGRNIRKTQLMTALLSGCILYIFWMVPLGGIYAQIYHIPRYWNMPVSGILSYEFCWKEMTYGSYFLLTALFVLSAVIICIPVIYGIVQISRNYVSLFLLSVPAVWVMYEVCAFIPFNYPMMNIRNLCSRLLHMPYSEAVCGCMLITITAVCLLMYLRKTEKADHFDL